MASTWRWSAYRGVTTAISTGLNALAANATALSAAIDNSTNRDLYADWELAWTWGTAPTGVSPACVLVQYPSIDGTNYATVPATGPRLPHRAFCSMFDRLLVNTAQRSTSRHILLTPGLTKFGVVNKANQAFSASGHTLKYNPYGLERGATPTETLRWAAYAGVQTVWTTDLDSFAANATLTSSAIDNSSTKYTHADFELVCQYTAAPTEWSGVVLLTLLSAVDGTNYTTAAHTGIRSTYFDPWVDGATAQRQIITHVPLPPGLFKIHIRQASYRDGAAAPTFAASGNTFRYNPYKMELA